MEGLAKTVTRINAVSAPSVQFPRFAITADTYQLQNIHHWIEIWNNCYEDFLTGSRRDYENRKLLHREMALERLIKNPHKPISAYANQLAEWAAIAGSFPPPCSEYWKEIIQKCASESGFYGLPLKHIQELLTHCEDEINAIGSIYSHALFNILRTAIQKHNNFLGDEDFEDSPTYKFLHDNAEGNVQISNIKQIVDSAALEEPDKKNFTSKFEYLRAKLKWDMAKRYGAGS